MAKYENIRALAKKQLQAVTESSDRWKAFLRTAAIAYNYSFPNQLLIHEQSPTATAVADICSTVYRSRRWNTACVTGLICFGWLVVSNVMRPERGGNCRGDFQQAAYCAYGTVRASMSFCCHDSKTTTC